MAKSHRELVLRDRLAWLEREAEKLRRQLKPYDVDQGELLDKPAAAPRALSRQQEDLEEFKATRATRLEELGVSTAGGVTDEEAPPIAYVNAVLKKIRAACDDRDDLLEALFDAFFALDWPARYEPPYAFRMFARDNTWPELLKTVKKAKGIAA